MNPAVLTPSEIQFFAEDTVVEISTTTTIPELFLLRRTYGPYRAHIPAEAPLWLALALKQRKRCKIRAPDWLQPKELKAVLEAENENDTKWAKVHPHYLEVGLELLKCAGEDIENANEVRCLLEDVWEVRQAKIKKQLHELQDPVTVEVTNLTMLEVNTFRSFLSQTMGQLYTANEVEQTIGLQGDEDR